LPGLLFWDWLFCGAWEERPGGARRLPSLTPKRKTRQACRVFCFGIGCSAGLGRSVPEGRDGSRHSPQNGRPGRLAGSFVLGLVVLRGLGGGRRRWPAESRRSSSAQAFVSGTAVRHFRLRHAEPLCRGRTGPDLCRASGCGWRRVLCSESARGNDRGRWARCEPVGAFHSAGSQCPGLEPFGHAELGSNSTSPPRPSASPSARRHPLRGRTKPYARVTVNARTDTAVEELQ